MHVMKRLLNPYISVIILQST